MKFKPMLADPCTDTSLLRFPVLVSKKYDGIRCMMQNGVLVSRSLKPIKNTAVQAKFAGLPEGTDGELIYGDPSAEDCFRQTTSIVMSSGKPADGVNFYAFDIFQDLPYENRLGNICDTIALLKIADVIFVEHVTIKDEDELLLLETAWLEEGHDGVMIRDPKGPYKQGRSTEAQGWLLKLKRFEDAEAMIVGFEEMLANENVATTNALGRTERSSHKAGMVPKGTLGKINVVGMGGKWEGVEFNIGSGFDMATRDDFWGRRDELVNKLVKYKFQACGSKDAPRIPIFHGLRDSEDM